MSLAKKPCVIDVENRLQARLIRIWWNKGSEFGWIKMSLS